MRWRNTGDLPPIPSDLDSPSQLFEAPQQAQAERNVLIYKRRRDGESYAEIAAEYGLSSTQVRAIIQDLTEVIRRIHETR